MFLNKKNNSRFSYIYTNILNTLVDRLKTTVVFFYSVLSRFFLLNKETSELDEYYSNAPQHWLNLIKRNHLNLDSFKRNITHKHLSAGQEKAKDNYFKGITKADRKITNSAVDFRKNKSAAQLSFKYKRTFSKSSENCKEQLSKADDVSKKKVKMYFASMLHKNKYMQSAKKVHKVEHTIKFLKRLESQIVNIDTKNDAANNAVIKDNSQLMKNKAAEYHKSMIKKNNAVMPTINVDSENHAFSYNDYRDYDGNLLDFSYKEKSNKKINKDRFIEQGKELLPDEKVEWLSHVYEKHFVPDLDNISLDELEINNWQDLPDDVWSYISSDSIYALKNIPGNNDVRVVLWNG